LRGFATLKEKGTKRKEEEYRSKKGKMKLIHSFSTNVI